MMEKFRFYIAMIMARLSFFGLKLLGRNATHLPGVIAVRICPNVLEYLEVGQQFVAITGTNGKTSTTNMVVSFLEAQGVDLCANVMGSNIEGGIISALLTSTTFFGKSTKDVTVFEVDERASLYIFPYIKPDLIAVTNLYRDSYARNAHVDYIVETLETSIPKSSTLILNGDDILTSNLMKDNKRRYFSIAPLRQEVEVKDSLIQDSVYCPVCDHPLTYDFQRYHHIGRVHCEQCGFTNSKADYEVIGIEDSQYILQEEGAQYTYHINTDNMSDHYNMLSAISVLREMGYDHALIQAYFENIKTVETRYDMVEKNDKRYVTMLSKDQNPVANSRVFDFIRQQESWGSRVIVMMNEAHGYEKEVRVVENMAWLYDANFEYLNIPEVKAIYCVGARAHEYQSRLALESFDLNKIHVCETLPEDIESCDTVIILHSTKNIPAAFRYRQQLIEKGVS